MEDITLQKEELKAHGLTADGIMYSFKFTGIIICWVPYYDDKLFLHVCISDMYVYMSELFFHSIQLIFKNGKMYNVIHIMNVFSSRYFCFPKN